MSIFTAYIGKEVTVIYTENDSQHVVKGLLKAEDENFIIVLADWNDLILNKTYVVKIKSRKEGENEL